MSTRRDSESQHLDTAESAIMKAYMMRKDLTLAVALTGASRGIGFDKELTKCGSRNKRGRIPVVNKWSHRMKINQYLVKRACPSSGGASLPDHCSWVFVNCIERAGLLAVALAAIVVLATGSSSTGTGFSERLISPVSNKQQATNSKDDSWYQTPRSPGFDPDLFGS